MRPDLDLQLDSNAPPLSYSRNLPPLPTLVPLSVLCIRHLPHCALPRSRSSSPFNPVACDPPFSRPAFQQSLPERARAYRDIDHARRQPFDHLRRLPPTLLHVGQRQQRRLQTPGVRAMGPLPASLLPDSVPSAGRLTLRPAPARPAWAPPAGQPGWLPPPDSNLPPTPPRVPRPSLPHPKPTHSGQRPQRQARLRRPGAERQAP